jgi:hypothetical protein
MKEQMSDVIAELSKIETAATEILDNTEKLIKNMLKI